MATNIAETFVSSAKEYRERIAVIEAKTAKEMSFDELNRRADAYANHFSSEGLRPGDITILMVKPSVDFICLALALFKVGTPIVLIDPGMGYRNLLKCVERVRPKYLVGIPQAILFSKIFRKPFQTIKKVFCCGVSFGFLGTNVTKTSQESGEEYPVYQPDETDLAAIIFTTGSTGPPKGVRYEHSIFSAQLRLIREYYAIGPGDIDQPAFPLFALFSAALGVCSVIPDMDPTRPAQVHPDKFVASIKKYQVTYSFGSPAIWNVVSRYCIDHGIVLDSVEKVLMAGAPVPYELLMRVRKILPDGAAVYTPYGATESLPIVSIEGGEVVTETWKQSVLGKGTCVGRALPGIDIKIITISENPLPELTDDMVVENGQIGEIIVRGDVVTRSYQNNPEETRLAKIRDGDTFWHRMGDVGYLDQADRLWFCGRRAHRVVAEHRTLYSVPCEAIINEHPDVYRSALVGLNDGRGRGTASPVIIIEPRPEKTISNGNLIEEVKKRAGQSELTRDIKHFLIHRSFPVDIRHNAKIFREKLALWAEKQLTLL
ncbi:MAG: fatty acid CoA ligase family protein [Desulforhopalus sp.]